MTMSHNRYREDLILTVEDFTGCGWKTALASAPREDYSSMEQVFYTAAKQAIDQDRQAHGKALWLLTDACSMILSPASVNEPFKPFWVFDGPIPDDFTEADIAFFAQVVEVIDDPWLKARLADLVWLRQRPREVKFALAAIDSYRLIPLNAETWLHSGQACWQRAVNLARRLDRGAGNRLVEIEASIVKAFEQDSFLRLVLAGLLKSNGLGGERSVMIAEKLESIARDLDSQSEFYQAREYFQASADWFKKAKNDKKSTELIIEAAETFVKEAKARIISDQPSHRVAASFYESAIQIYRTVPRSKRAVYRINERIVELQKLLNESTEKSLNERQVIEAPGIDMSEIIENTRKSIRNKNPIEALQVFANIHPAINIKQLRENVMENIRRHPMLASIPGKATSSDGRVIAKHPGMNHSDSHSDDNEKVIRSLMIRKHSIQIGCIVQGMIWPALEEMLLEHRLREADFIGIAKQSPIVPIGRELLFGKALFAGYEWDFATALHLLTPQIEHLVRFHLKQADVQTTNLSNDGIANENGLSSLMDIPETEKIFGADLSFEIKALFCDPFGPNLRNEVAHGLLDDGVCWSVHAVYAWWLGLKLVFNTFFNTLRKSTENGEQNTEQ